MSWIIKHKAIALIAVGIALYIWSMRKAVGATPSEGIDIKRGRIDSGNSFGYFDVNPDSPTFGERVFGTYGEED